MPDRPLTVLTYAASASLAAAALVYFFNPNQLLDGESSSTSSSTRKKGVVGLVNPANDCFINSVLQSLAGLGDLRLFLIREVHRRQLDASIYTSLSEKDGLEENGKKTKLLSLQTGEVTRGLKLMLDQLNERPIYKKTISAQYFIQVLENAFGTRISRAQQDAQELLQVVAERLSEEYEAGLQARRRARNGVSADGIATSALAHASIDKTNPSAPALDPSAPAPELLETFVATDEEESEVEEGFPLQGQTEARVECQHCRFAPRPTPTNFVMLNLMVPQKSTAGLNECFDDHFKTEYIEDYKCDKCRLQHAIETLDEELTFAGTEEQRVITQTKLDRVQKALDVDPEKPPDRIQLPDIKHAPKRKIARHVSITKFPKVLVIHLSRSVYDPGTYSQKNSAKLSFPERLPIGGILNRKNYKLLGLVTHQGTHNSGHYETFRRQHVYPPTSAPHVKKAAGPYSTSPTPDTSHQPSPRMSADLARDSIGDQGLPIEKSPLGQNPLSTSPSPVDSSASLSPPSSRPTSGSAGAHSNAQNKQKPSPAVQDQSTSVLTLPKEPPRLGAPSLSRYTSSLDLTRLRRKKKTTDRWWRISDEKIRECNTTDVLAMQKDVYMLFYEMERTKTASL